MNDSRIDVVNALIKISSLTFSVTAGPNLNSGPKRITKALSRIFILEMDESKSSRPYVDLL